MIKCGNCKNRSNKTFCCKECHSTTSLKLDRFKSTFKDRNLIKSIRKVKG